MTLSLPKPKPWYDVIDEERRALALEQADLQNHKRTADIDHPFSLALRRRLIVPPVTFADQDATPSVAEGTYFVTANTVATTVTDFDDPTSGQIIIVEIGDALTTIDFTASGLKGNVGVDWSPTTGDHMTCVYNGTDWLCDVSDNTA